jgi:cytochrome b involved in lipid metabolism
MAAPAKKFTLDDLKAKNSRQGLYVLLHNKVYDVTKFIDEHPGGDEVILAEAGQDATDAFEDVGHSDEARELLVDFYVGDFDESSATKAKKEAKAATKAASAAVEQGSNLMYFVPLTLLVGYFAWRYYGNA